MPAVAWRDKSPDQKLATITTMLVYAFITLTVLGILFARIGLFDIKIVNYTYNVVSKRGFNIFTLTQGIIILLIVFYIAKIVQLLIQVTTESVGSRAETLGHLLASVIRYGVVIWAIFYILYLCGLDTGSLLASAGILSLVVGLGAQSMIQDILAGLFIVFEGEFRVGDIVTVGDFRGNVLEIGLRTTKIEDTAKNIKVFNNSQLSGIINMTKEVSCAVIDVGIEYGESLERVEMILNDEFPAMRRRLPAIIDGPFYKGVSALNTSSVDIKIIALCKEKNRMQLCRDLNREVFLLFKKHNVGIPFPQITVSYLKDEEPLSFAEKDKNETEKDKNDVQTFV